MHYCEECQNPGGLFTLVHGDDVPTADRGAWARGDVDAIHQTRGVVVVLCDACITQALMYDASLSFLAV